MSIRFLSVNRTGSRVLVVAILAACGVAPGAYSTENAAEEGEALAPVIVSATREAASLAEVPVSIGVIEGDSVRSVGATHPQQILSQVPGVAVSVTNGEGHTTAIRQPFTTAPLYLYLEDGLPIRATGFFNHNALYELDLPMAGGIEVIRGPGSALHGSDAIGGIVNMLTRKPSEEADVGATLDVGSHGWRRLMLEGDSGAGALGAMRGGVNITHTAGWRNRTAYDRQAFDGRWDVESKSGWRVKTVLAGGRIDQETGANSPLIFADYLNDPERNNFSIAYRKVQALRVSSAIEREFGDGLLSITPYLRDNRMELLASFMLSFDPTVSTTQNRSYGAQLKWRQDAPNFMRARVIGGVDVDVSPGSREENRLSVIVTGAGASRAYVDYTVGARVYDYDVTFTAVSPYLHAELSPLDRLRVTAGVRYDRFEYDFRNDFDTAFVQGAVTAFYGQAPDVKVDFDHASPKIGVTFALSDAMNLYASYNTGFRAPSEGQLFRPSVATTPVEATGRALAALDLKPITATQAEIGWRSHYERWSLEVAAFELVKRDDLVSQRNTTTNVTTSVNAGKTSHRGVEVAFGVQPLRALRFDSALSYTRHRYEDWATSSGVFSGKEIETAPRRLANSRLTWSPLESVDATLEWIHIGSYWLEASNSPTFGKYDGHDLLNLRARWQATSQFAVFGRVYNLRDTRYADSSSVSSSTPVYSPGLPRTYYAGVDWRWK